MPPSTTSLFPDINVWLALSYEGHVHHLVAADWFMTLTPDATFAFCRFTQLGLLRLLSAEAIMRDEAMTQPQAWAVYDRWLRDPRVDFVNEPPGLDVHFRALTRARQPATKDWADSYLAAFATAGHLTLVTFDRRLKSKVKSGMLLAESSS
jgi:toxin-antitoxin system PIN domain toxin